MKRIKIVYGIAGGLLLLAGVLLLALFRPGAFLHLERKQTETTPKPGSDSKPEVSWQESEQEESKQQELEQQESEQQES